MMLGHHTGNQQGIPLQKKLTSQSMSLDAELVPSSFSSLDLDACRVLETNSRNQKVTLAFIP